jgi:hypothetical protein
LILVAGDHGDAAGATEPVDVGDARTAEAAARPGD